MQLGANAGTSHLALYRPTIDGSFALLQYRASSSTIISVPAAFLNQGRSHPPWCCHRHLTTALSALARLHLLNELGDGALVMHEQFRSNFRLALTGG